jgi:hypothetical protein
MSDQRRVWKAILELDEPFLRDYWRKNIPPPSSDMTFWKGVHKARAELPIATAAQKAESLAWLKAHGSGPLGHRGN